MGECLDQQAKLSPSLREEKSHAGITSDNYQILPPSSNHIYTQIDTEMETIALYAKKSTSKKLEAVRFQKSKKPDQQPQEGE